MILDRVTMTGPDDSMRPEDLFPIAREFTFVEFGILFGSKEGRPRFPSRDWLYDLKEFCEKYAGQPLRLSAHLCGRYVRDLIDGNFSWRHEFGPMWHLFQRVQVNFHGRTHDLGEPFQRALENNREKEYILQHDGVNDEVVARLCASARFRAVPLFDTSGGAGVSPRAWPRPICGYNGYAGGIGPDNVVAEIVRIREVVDAEVARAADDRLGRAWIDMETKIRSEDDEKFDLFKVKKVLALCAPCVQNGDAHPPKVGPHDETLRYGDK